jgi:hypothetical protein
MRVDAHLAGAAVLLAVLVLLYALSPTVFPLAVSAALAAGWSINARAFLRLRSKMLTTDPDGRGADIASLRTAYYGAMLLLIASTSLLILAAVVFLVFAKVIPPPGPGLFGIGISFAALLLTGPAFDFLLTFRPDE